MSDEPIVAGHTQAPSTEREIGRGDDGRSIRSLWHANMTDNKWANKGRLINRAIEKCEERKNLEKGRESRNARWVGACD